MIRKAKKQNPYASISLPKRSDGGYHTFKSAKELLEKHGITDVEPSVSYDAGCFGIQVKTRFKQKAYTLLKAMPVDCFLEALAQLKLTVAGQRTAHVLGLSIRQCQRIAADAAPVPGPVERLLKVYLKHGIIEDD